MPISVYDVNTFLRADATLTSIAGKVMNFFPVIGYGSETAPFVVYYYEPGTPSIESYWMRRDAVRYSIYDSDVARLFSITERFIALLGKSDQVQGTIPSSNVRILNSFLYSTNLTEPIEKEGWYLMDMDFYLISVSL